jgi:hypothetical protein
MNLPQFENDNFFTDELPLSELVHCPDRVMSTEAANSGLHYCSPAHGGWGMIKIALLVPDIYLLFACPSACGRHGAIAAIEQGYRNRVAYLCIDDNEIVLGSYEAEIEKAVRTVLSRANPRPHAFMIFVSCIDDLLGTDHPAALARMEEEHGIPFRLAKMNPISMDGNLPPGVRVQRSIYQFLDKPEGKDRGILFLGGYRPPSPDSELARFIEYCGFGPLRHPEFVNDFDEFKTLSRSAAAILVRPEGRAAAEDLESRLDIPFVRGFMAYDRETILKRYEEIARFLGKLDGKSDEETESRFGRERLEAWFRPRIREAEEREADARELLGNAGLSIDSTVTIAPFSLALALVRAGINVERIYTDGLPAFDKASFEKLAEIKGDILVCNPSHVRKYGPPPDHVLTEIAAGFEAAYAAASPVSVSLAFDEQMYGFEGYVKFLDALISAVEKGKSNLKQQIKEYGLVI